MNAPRVLLDGVAFGESPRWRDGRLWFADWGSGEIVAVDAAGRPQVVARSAAPPLCFDFLPDGRMLLTGPNQGRLLRREADGALALHAELGGPAVKGLNDIVVDGRGNAYVNGAGYDMMAGEPFKPGVILLVTPQGAARQVADGIAFPNGMAVTPDNRVLIVAESYAKRLTAFDIGADGDLSNRRVWADLGDGVPDGICIDGEGAVWYADVPNRRCVRVRERGEVLQVIDADRGCFACVLGGHERSTLYVTAQEWRGVQGMADMGRTGQVLAYPAPAPGVGWP